MHAPLLMDMFKDDSVIQFDISVGPALMMTSLHEGLCIKTCISSFLSCLTSFSHRTSCKEVLYLKRVSNCFHIFKQEDHFRTDSDFVLQHPALSTIAPTLLNHT